MTPQMSGVQPALGLNLASFPPHFLFPHSDVTQNYSAFLIFTRSAGLSHHVEGMHLVHAWRVGVMVTLDVPIGKLRRVGVKSFMWRICE